VGGLCRAVVEAQIVPSCCLQTFMAENFLDVPNRAAVKKKLSRGSVAKQVGSHSLLNSARQRGRARGREIVYCLIGPFGYCQYKQRE